MSKKYEVFGKRVALDLFRDSSEYDRVMRNIEQSLNDAIHDAYRKDPTARVNSVRLDMYRNACYVSVEVTP